MSLWGGGGGGWEGGSWLSCPGLKHGHLWELGLPGPQRCLAHCAVQAGSKGLPV